MTGDEAVRQLAEIPEGEFRGLARLAQRISDDSRKPPQTLTGLWQSGSAAERAKAGAVLEHVGAISVPALFRLGDSAAGERRAHAVTQAARAYTQASTAAMTKLTRMMESKAPMPLPSSTGPPPEEKELPSRECDEGYLLARRLLNVEDAELDRSLLRKQFLLMEKTERDNEIDRFRRTGKWSRIVDRAQDETGEAE